MVKKGQEESRGSRRAGKGKEDSRRFRKVQEGSRRFKLVQAGSRKFERFQGVSDGKKVLKGSRRI